MHRNSQLINPAEPIQSWELTRRPAGHWYWNFIQEADNDAYIVPYESGSHPYVTIIKNSSIILMSTSNSLKWKLFLWLTDKKL